MAAILTPDQRVRVFVSSTSEELAAERVAARRAIETLRLIASLRERLAPDAFGAAWRSLDALPFPAALALVLETLDPPTSVERCAALRCFPSQTSRGVAVG